MVTTSIRTGYSILVSIAHTLNCNNDYEKNTHKRRHCKCHCKLAYSEPVLSLSPTLFLLAFSHVFVSLSRVSPYENASWFLYQTETTGSHPAAFSDISDLEILFTTCHEIGAKSLGDCVNLRRLALIDNGLEVISNLSPVRSTLVSLTLCGQSITEMKNLDLPFLKELFLHNNMISKIGSLNHCPRLKRLWLFRNQISKIENLHGVPELEEVHLQSNMIASTGGLESNLKLKNLNLAGNKIANFVELHKLSKLDNLRELTCHDIHFGKCPIVDNIDGKGANYREFVACFLPNVERLDGVVIGKEAISRAEASYVQEVRTNTLSMYAVYVRCLGTH